jgi:hypothetical protein
MPFRVVHLASIGVVVLQAWLGVICPLTIFENWLREKAGGAIYEMTFIGHWSSRLLFYEAPSWVFTLCYTLFGAMVLACFIGYPPRRKNRLAAPDAPPQDVGVR